jgi:hypothetical protein
MKRALILLISLGLIMSFIALTGCGGKRVTAEKTDDEVTIEAGENGEATVENGEGEVTTESEEGDSAVESGESGENTENGDSGQGGESEVTPDISYDVPSEEELGAPIYPGAVFVPGSGGTVTDPGSGQSASMAEYKTNDAYDKVVSFYTTNLGRPTENVTMQQATWMKQEGEGSFTIVTVEVKGGEVVISIGRIVGDLNM